MKDRLHTAAHILFSVVGKRFKIKVKKHEILDDSSWVIYETDSDIAPMKDEFEAEVNKIIKEAREVKFYKLARNEAREIVDISSVPFKFKDIMIYEIVGINKIACAGPHVKNTQEIGNLRIIEIKNVGENTFRLSFTVE